MDKPTNVDLSAADASVSNIPTATPIASEIISDFEPDPKFEMTPLEKATFDCNDIFLQDSNLSELVQQSENGDQQTENGAHKLDREQVSQVSGVDKASDDNKVTEILSPLGARSEPKPSANSQASNSEIRNDGQQLAQPSNDIPKINDCPSSSDKVESDADHLTATISLDESIAATALVEVAERQAVRVEAFAPQITKVPGINRQQYSAITTPQQTEQTHINVGNDNANYLFSSSQTSVDALRDKVIESALELGEAHDFSHAPIQVEDREKLFERIHREVNSIPSSIDLIADVASRQQSIEISSNAPEKHMEQPISEQMKHKQPISEHSSELKMNEGSSTSSEGKEHTERSDIKDEDSKAGDLKNGDLKNENTKETPDKAESVLEFKTTEEVICEPENISKATEEPQVEIPEIEPIIEEPPVVPNLQTTEEEEAGKEHAEEEVADIIVEPVESADETAEPLDLVPIIEEASSADEQDKADDVAEVIPEEPAQALPEESPKNPEVGSSKSETEAPVPAPIEETGRRKSGRKVKPPKSMDDEPKIEESPRGSRRISSRKRQEEAETPVASEKEAQEELQVSAAPDEEKTGNLSRQQEQVCSKPEPESDSKIETTDTEETKMDVSQEEDYEGKVTFSEAVEPEATAEPVGRSGRSLRVRAPKRKLEEETDDSEPLKKQAKNSRPSYEPQKRASAPIRSTSIIKLPALKPKLTISTPDPSIRPSSQKRRATITTQASDKKYVCKECGFATERLDNIVYHNTKSFCRGKSAMAEMMKNDIIKQQQSKGKRKQQR